MADIKAPHEVLLSVLPEWIDSNGHLHDACYLEAFHVGVRDFFKYLRVGREYQTRGHTTFNLGVNIDFVAEVFDGAPIRLATQLVDWDHKRLHIFSQMFHGETGVLCATAERLVMNIDMQTRRSIAFLPNVYERVCAVGRVHAALARPRGLGRTLGIRRGALRDMASEQ